MITSKHYFVRNYYDMTITQSSTRLVFATTVAIAAVALAFSAAVTPAHAASVCPGTTFTATLKMGQTNSEVMKLQQFLNMSADTQIAASGVGSAGMETSYFGGLTKVAVNKFQAKYASDILAPQGLSTPTGTWGAGSRAKANMLCSGSTGSTGSTGGNTTPSGSGLSVSAGVQPANGLAPYNAARIPFTNFTVSASNDGDVTLNSVTVQRGGASSDASFNGVELIDMNSGVQIGISKTLNSNHQATIGDPVVIPRGTSRTFTVAANRTTQGSHGGEVASFSVVAVNTSAAVNGSLPIMGASHTINESLVVGSVSTSTSSFVPPTGTTHTQTIGDAGVRFSGVKFTANSAEDLRLYSIRWRQVGSASSADIANIMTVVNGTSYPVTTSTDGKYFTSTFPGGILIPKGNSIDAYVQGDLVGSNSSGRTIEFDIDKVTDTYFVGQLYGYGVGYSPSYSTQPSYKGDSFSVQAGTATTINKANEVTAQNIAVNVPNQVLGGFATNFLGEPVSVQTIKLTIATSSGFTGAGPITSISIVDKNGAVVAGPIDEATSCTSGCQVVFSDTVTFPVGRSVYTVKGKVPSGVANNSTVIVSVDPSTWTNVTGQVSGNSVSLSGNTNFALNTMTVKAATVAITASSQPSAQTVVGGVQNFTFANIQIDASQSGEDIRISSLPVRYTGTASQLTGCQIWDGTTALNNGSRVINSLTSGADNSFTFDNSLVIPKGSVKTLAVSCNVSSSANSGTHIFGVNSAGSFTATGVTSGVSITPTVTTSNSGLMTIASGGKGSLTVTVDPSSPSYAPIAGGSTGVTTGVIKVHATNEAVNLTKLGLVLTPGTSPASGNSASDYTQVYLYNGSTLVGTATFTGSNTTATSTFTSSVTVPKDGDLLLTVKADTSLVGTSQPGVSGDLLAVDPQNAEGSGVSSGATIQSGATAGVAGLRLFRTYPSLAIDSLSSTGVADGRLMRFKVTANASGNVGIAKFTFAISTSTATVSNIGLYAYTDASYSSPVSDNVGAGSGQVNTTLATTTCGATFDTPAGSTCRSTSSLTTLVFKTATNALQVPANSTRYFELRGSVSGTQSGSSVVTTMSADTSAATGTVTSLNSGSNFIWSPNSTTTAALTGDNDWTNGYGLPGFPTSGLIQTRSN